MRLKVIGLIALALLSTAGPAHALFEDKEARIAILQARERIDDNALSIDSIRKNMLAMDSRLSAVQDQNAVLLGQVEQLTVTLQQYQDRLKALEPRIVEIDDMEFTAKPDEILAYDTALTYFKAQDYRYAQSTFEDFISAFPLSGYKTSAYFWLANSMYAQGDCKNALTKYEEVLKDPEHLRVPDALGAMASCYAEMKNPKKAKEISQRLVSEFPQSQAAELARSNM